MTNNTDTSTGQFRIGIVGCGAAALSCHLPALAEGGPFRLTALVDRISAHAVSAAHRYRALLGDRDTDADDLATAYEVAEVTPLIDAAVVATSHASHAEVTAELLAAGKHVLVEKPLTLTSADAERLRDQATRQAGKVLPAHVRRLFPSATWVREVLERGVLGRVGHVRWHEGQPYSWPVTTGFMFSGAAGGGVLTDSGPHVFDMLRYWFGDLTGVLGYADNNDGGTETEAEITLRFGAVTADVALSRLRRLSNDCAIVGDRATLVVGTGFPATYRLYDLAGDQIEAGPVPVVAPAETTWTGLFRGQFDNFAAVIAGRPGRLATFEDGVASVEILERIRTADRRTLPRPWRQEIRRTSRPPVPHIAVTGATGFIGAHVVERHAGRGGQVTAVVRDLSRTARLAHLSDRSVRYAHADVRDHQALVTAFAGVDVVVHTAFGGLSGDPAEQWSVSVEGTRAVLDAATAAGARRLVHLGTVAVYDDHRDVITEASPLVTLDPGDRGYVQQKLAAGRLIATAHTPLDVVEVQPTVVYGPGPGSWTMGPLTRLRQGAALPGGAEGGVCNAVHVFDVADAVLAACTADEVTAARLLVSGPETVRWGEFYDAYRAVLGQPTGRSGDPAQLADWERELYASRAVVDTGALRSLGFRPVIGFAEGMESVQAWARWAGLS